MKKIISFVALSYVFAWGVWGIFYLTGNGLSPLALTLGMFAPSLAYLVLKLAYRETHLGASFHLNFRSSWRFYLLALVIPALATLIGYLLYFGLFPKEFVLQAELISSSKQAGIPITAILGETLVATFLFAPIINAFAAIGEETGWRGFLFPQLREHFSAVTSHILVGLIWSLWHLPLNLQGYNYGLSYSGGPWLGMIAMFMSCFSLSVILSHLVKKTGSLWSSALLHGAVNSWGRLFLLFQLVAKHAIWGPSLNGILSGLPLLLLAIVILIKEEKYGTGRDF